jgi:hypothetical protein
MTEATSVKIFACVALVWSASKPYAVHGDVGKCRLLRSVAKLVQETDRPNSNRQDAYSDTKCEVPAAVPPNVRSGDDPDDASADYSEKNKIGERGIAHRINSFPARTPTYNSK